MKRFISLMMVVMTIGLFSCSSDKSNKTVRNNGSSETIKTEVNSELSSDIIEQVKAGLPAASLAQLLTDSQDISAFEDALNVEGGINNLDIDGDGFPDQLSVQDCSDGEAKKLAILGIYDDGDINLMEFKMIQNGESFTVECAPNPQYYGSDSYYRSDYRRGNGFVTGMMLGYLFSPRYVHYAPRYHRYGYHGSRLYVRSYHVVPMSRYRTRTVVTRTTTRASKRYNKPTSRPSSYKKSYNVKNKSSKISKKAKRSSLKNQTKSTKSLKKGTGANKKAGFLKGGSKASPNTKAINGKAGNSLPQKSANRSSLKKQTKSTKSLKKGTGATKKSSFFGSKAKSSKSGSTSTRSSSRRRSSSSTTSRKSSSRKSSSSRSRSSSRRRSDANFKTQIEYLQ